MKNLLIFLLRILGYASFCQDITVPEPEYFGNVVYVKNNKAVDLEKQKVHVTVKAGASLYITGLGKIKQQIVINGNSSDVKIEEDRNLKFIIKVVDNKYDPFDIVEIFKLEKHNDTRSLLTAETGSFSGSKAGDMVRVAYKATKYGNNSFLINVPSIGMGEYAFNIKIRDGNGAKDESSFTLHLFAVTSTSLKVGDKIEYMVYVKNYVGTIEEIKGNKVKVKTSSQGNESIDKLDLEDGEVRLFTEEEPKIDPTYQKDDLPNGIKVGDTVKWKVLLIENWSGIYLGIKNDKAIIKTTDKGRFILKEVDFNKTKLTKS